jgi:signal transduction histidine kinase
MNRISVLRPREDSEGDRSAKLDEQNGAEPSAGFAKIHTATVEEPHVLHDASASRDLALLDAIDTAVFAFDQQGALEYANAAARRLTLKPMGSFTLRELSSALGLVEETARSQDTDDRVSPSRPLFGLPFTPCHVVVDAVHADGKRALHVRTRSLPSANARVVRHLVEVSDISEPCDTSMRRAAVERMRAVSLTAGRLAGEMRTTLLRIKSSVHALVESSQGDPSTLRDLTTVLQITKQGSDLSDKMLAYARRSETRSVRTDLKSQLHSLERLLAALAGSDATVALEIDDETPLRVLIDPRTLEQILVELTQNARDAMLNGGAITIEARRVAFETPRVVAPRTVAPSGTYACLTFSDTGVGCRPEVAARVFEPFFSTRPSELKPGLGMSMVYGAVKQAGGFIDFETVEGEGTTVRIWFPALADSAPAHDEVVDLETHVVALVNEDACLRRVMRASLESHGYAVTELATLRDAPGLPPSWKSRHVVALVSGDQFGEGRDLERFCRHFAHPPTFVFVDDGMHEGALQTHSDGGPRVVLTMPITPQRLLDVVRRATRSEDA